MRTRPTPMTPDEFHLLPRRPGWKHEYWGGKAYIQPRPSVAIARAPIVPRSVSAPDGFRLRPVTPADAPLLIHAFFDAFRDSIDYWGYPLPRIRADSQESILTCFAGRRGAFHSVSCLAVAPTGRSIAGAALVVEDADGPNLDLLFVRPRWQRRGLAVALVQSAMNALHEAGETHLDGGYNVANEASAAVHRRLGFEELPDLSRAQDELHCARHELRRREQLGDLADVERQELERAAAHWEAVHQELRAVRDRDGYEAVSPILRRGGGTETRDGTGGRAMIPDIILIGPIGAGKSTLAALLAERLGVPRCGMDIERWPYMQEAGYDPTVADEIKKRDRHYRNVFAYWKRFEAHMAERLLAEHRGCVIDFGASQSVYEAEADFACVQKALADYANVVLVLPSPDPAESLRVLKARVWDGVAGGFDFQEHFVNHPSNRRLATLTVYTEGKTPEETCDEILRRLPLPLNVPDTQEETP